MKGLKRYKPHTVRVALPITPKILLKIKNELESTDINSYTYWSIFFYAFYLMCRKSNLVGTAEDDSKCLYRGDIKVFKEYVIVKFHWSKTIQFGKRCLEIPIIKNSPSSLCAYSAFKVMCTQFSVSSSSPELMQVQGDWKSDAYKLYLRYGFRFL
jgi:hypothetical protein